MTAHMPHDVHPDEVSWMATWQGRTGCPAPDLLLPALERTLQPGELAAAVRAHVAECSLCTELAAALAGAAEAVPAEIERIDQRITVQTSQGWRLRWTTYAAAAAVIAVAGTAYFALVVYRGAAPPVRVAASPDGRMAGDARVLPLAPPAIVLPAESLVMRGQDRTPYSRGLETALEPFAGGDFQEAAVRLERLARAYPGRVHAELYLGVSRLMTGAAASAVPALEQARELAPPDSSLYADATWYLAVALERSGQAAAAVDPLSDICGGGGPREADACEGLRRLLER